MTNRFGWLCFSVVAVGAILQPQERAADRVTVPFSDPARPKTVKVSLLQGGITVKGYNGAEVIVEARVRPGRSHELRRREPEPATKGLRRLDSAVTGLTVEEQDNTVSVSAHGAADLDIQVPANTSLKLKSINDGAIQVEGVSGEIDANALNGVVRLTNVSGAVVAHSLNGTVTVVLDKVAADKPMSFSTLNGDVDVTLPAAAKARLKMKTDRGEIYSDFEVNLAAPVRPTATDSRKEGGKYRIQFDKTLQGTINGGGPEMQFTTLNGRIYLRKK